MLLELKWWDFKPDDLIKVLPVLTDPDLEKVEREVEALKSDSLWNRNH